jgi:hypothetical protein
MVSAVVVWPNPSVQVYACHMLAVVLCIMGLSLEIVVGQMLLFSQVHSLGIDYDLEHKLSNPLGVTASEVTSWCESAGDTPCLVFS